MVEMHKPDTIGRPPLMRRPENLPPLTAGRNDIERELVAIWQEFVRVAPLGIDDDYFEIGGDSFAALGIFEAIEQRWGVRLPVSTLSRTTTVRELAVRIETLAEGDVDPVIVPLNPRIEGVPTYWVHGLGGEVLFARRVAVEMRAGPGFGVRLPDTFTGRRAPDEVAGYAEVYGDHIERHAGNDGPIVVAGFCAGGLIAVEIARRLRSRGRAVPLVVLVDATLWGSSGIFHRAIHHLTRPMRFGYKDPLRVWRMQGHIMADRLVSRLAGRRAGLLAGRGRATRRSLPNATELSLIHALRTYRPEPFDGDAAVVASEEFAALTRSPLLGWAPHLTGRVEALQIGRKHGAVLYDPLLGQFVAAMDGWIAART